MSDYRFNPKADRFQNTPRKVFDKHVDRMEVKRLRDREDHRNDLKAIFQRLKNLETELTQLIQQFNDLYSHVDRHCAQLDTSREDTRDS